VHKGVRVKVLRLIARLNTGGPAIHTILLTQGLNGTRFTSRLVTGLVGPGEGDMGYFAASRGVVPIVIPELGRDVSFRNDVRALWKVFRLICREQPDVIHTHTAKAGGVGRVAGCAYNIWRALTGRPRAKLIHSFHGHIFHGYFSPWKSRLLVLIEWLLAKVTHRMIAVSEAIRHDLTNVYRVCRPDRVRVVPLGLDIGWVDELPAARGALRREFSIPDERTTVGVIGRLTEIKNHALFLSALRLLRDERVHGLIIGDGELRPSLEDMASALNLGSGVTFTGWQKDVRKIYADVDIVCLTSLNEGTPLALIEGMAAGRPFVATDVGGVRNLMVGDGQPDPSGFRSFENGILVGPNDASALVAALRWLIVHPDVRRAMGAAGQRSVQARYSHRRLVEDIASLYLELLEIPAANDLGVLLQEPRRSRS
jgi:glycosyltransferase involved in cell wall biosynthesis